MPSYFDHAATSPLRPQAQDVLVESLGDVGNAASLHRLGQRARRRLEEAREELAAAAGAKPSEVVFTSGGSEADSIALLGAMRARPDRPRALLSAVEHPAVLEAQRFGAEVLEVGPNGIVTPEAWAQVDEATAVVSVMAVNNETGIRQPFEPLVMHAQRAGAWSHSDAVQAFGHVPLDFGASELDLMSISAHKIGGPVGIGALLVRRGVAPAPIGLGGGQEQRIRSGTSPVALAASFAAAASVATACLDAEAARLCAWRDEIRALGIACGGRINGTDCAPHIVNITFPGLRSQDLLFLLDSAGICAAAGSACRAGVNQPSHVLLAMGASEADASASLRISFGHTTTAAEVEHLRRVLPDAVARARAAG